jgi:uncharacterized protein (DUF4415 family)
MSKKLKLETPQDDNPEWSARDVAQALPAAQVLPLLFGDKQAQDMLKPRGRPVLERPKEHVNIRLDADIVGAFRQTGAGWQTRVNNALRDWLKTHPKQSLIRR